MVFGYFGSVVVYTVYNKALFRLVVGLMLTAFCPSAFAQIGKQPSVSLVVLGTIQDGGAPHAGCRKDCCKRLFDHPDQNLQVVSLGLIDHASDKNWLFEAPPDFTLQAKAH